MTGLNVVLYCGMWASDHKGCFSCKFYIINKSLNTCRCLFIFTMYTILFVIVFHVNFR